MADAVDEFRTSFLRRIEQMLRPGQRLVDEPGICGSLGSPGEAPGRLLITDDRAERVVTSFGGDVAVQTASVFASAPRSRAAVEALGSWMSEDATAMLCSDLSAVTAPPLPEGLVLRPVRRVDGDDEGIPLDAGRRRACAPTR